MSTVRVLYLNPHGERAGAERFVDALVRGHRRRDPVRYDPVVVCGSEGSFSRELRADGVEVHVRPMRLRGLVPAVWWLRDFLKREKVRIVHTTMAHYHQFAWLAARGLGVKTLWFNHGPCTASWWKGVCHAFPADATVVAGRFMERQHRGFALSPKPRLIPMGLEERWFEPRPDVRQRARAAYGVQEGEVAVGILGRIDEWKGQHLFLDAAARVPHEVAQRYRFFVGGSPALGRGAEYFNKLQGAAAAHPYADRVHLLGQVHAEEFWEAMDVAVHCSRDEPFGYVVMEAMAKGKFVIGADSGGVPEMIADGKNGRLVDPADADALARAMVQDSDAMREAARRMARERFAGGRVVDDFERLYDELLGRG